MAQAFDPYHKWPGIAPKDQPPNHYRLLGIELFEDDCDELAAARVCLLKPEGKAEYDARLRRWWRFTAMGYARWKTWKTWKLGAGGCAAGRCRKGVTRTALYGSCWRHALRLH